MAVVANISVLLSARIEGYRSQIGFARQDNESFARSATQAGLKIRDAGKAMDILRQRSFDQLSTQQKLNEEIRAINHLFKAGIIDQGNYAKAMVQLNEAYRQKAALEAAKAQESLNNSIQRGTQIMRPQIAVQKEALAEYKRTALALRELEQSGTAKKLGITSEEIENRRREAFLTGQAKFQGKETPAQIQERTAKATEAATEAVTKFNARFQTARQRLSETISVLRDMRSQAELAAKPLDIRAQQEFVRKAIEDFRRDSGLDDKLRREAKAQEESNKAVQRGIQLLDKNYAARQRLGNQLRDLQAAAKSDPDRFGGQKLEDARKKAFQEYRNETQSSTQLAAASVDKFNEKFVTAKQRLRDTINELRVMRQNAAEAGKVLDANAQKQFIRKAVDTYRRDSGLDDQLSEQAVAREAANKAAERGIQLVDKELVANGRRRQQLMQQLADINAAREAYKGLDVRKFASASAGIFDELNALRDGRESPAAIAERKAQELATRKAAIEKENIAAIKATMTAEQARATEYAKINQDIVDGLSQEAAARRRLAVDSEFNKRTGVDQRLQIEADLVQKYNESIARGTQIARPAKAATDEYRQTVKDLGRALNAAKINQQEYNVARLQATRLRQDASISPILQSGINQVAPYKQVIQTVVRSIQDMRIALAAGKVTQAEYNQTMQFGHHPTIQLANALSHLHKMLKAGQISQKEFGLATRLARREIVGQQGAISRLLGTLSVFRTVFIGMASAQLYSGVFNAISGAFEFEPEMRRAIALFGELEEAQKKALRGAVISSTDNNVNLVERAKVMQELAKDGLDASTAILSFERTLKFASASGLSAEDAVAKVSEVFTAYGLATKDPIENTMRLFQIMDLLQDQSLKSAATVELLAESYLRAAPQANLLGIELREIAKASTAFARIGRFGDVAGNEISIAIRDLTIKTLENRKAWDDASIAVFDAKGNFVGLQAVVRQLADSFAKLSPEQAVMQLQMLGVTQKASQFQQQLIALADEIDATDTSLKSTAGAVEYLHKNAMTPLEIATNRVSTAFQVIVNMRLVAYFNEISTFIIENREQMKIWATVAVAAIGFVIAAMTAYVLLIGLAIKRVVELQAKSSVPGWISLVAGFAVAALAAAGMAYELDQLDKAYAVPKVDFSDINEAVNETDRLKRVTKETEDAIAKQRSTYQSMINEIEAAMIDADFQGLFNDKFSVDTNKLRLAIDSAAMADLDNAKVRIEEMSSLATQWLDTNQHVTASPSDLRTFFADLSKRIRESTLALKELNDADIKQSIEDFANFSKSLNTPFESALDELNRLQNFKEIGLPVTPVIEARAIEQILTNLENEFQAKTPELFKVNAAAELRGSNAEFSSRVTMKLQESERDERRSQHLETIRELRELRQLSKVIDAIKELGKKQFDEEVIKLDGDF